MISLVYCILFSTAPYYEQNGTVVTIFSPCRTSDLKTHSLIVAALIINILIDFVEMHIFYCILCGVQSCLIIMQVSSVPLISFVDLILIIPFVVYCNITGIKVERVRFITVFCNICVIRLKSQCCLLYTSRCV